MEFRQRIMLLSEKLIIWLNFLLKSLKLFFPSIMFALLISLCMCIISISSHHPPKLLSYVHHSIPPLLAHRRIPASLVRLLQQPLTGFFMCLWPPSIHFLSQSDKSFQNSEHTPLQGLIGSAQSCSASLVLHCATLLCASTTLIYFTSLFPPAQDLAMCCSLFIFLFIQSGLLPLHIAAHFLRESFSDFHIQVKLTDQKAF